MSERMIWVVRLIGIVVFLVLMYLLMSLHSRLVKMNEEAGTSDRPVSSRIEDRESRIANLRNEEGSGRVLTVSGRFAIRNPQSAVSPL